MATFIATVADAIEQARKFAHDTNVSHRVAPDELSEYCDGSRVTFPLSNKNIVVGNGSCLYMADGGALTALDPQTPAMGLVTISPAPAATLEFYYYYQYCLDPEVQNFLDTALSEMDFTEANLSPDSSTGITMPEPLYRSACKKAAAYINSVMMAEFVKQYDVESEGVAYHKSAIYQGFQKLYQDNLADAERIQADYWSNQKRSLRGVTGRSSAGFPGARMMPDR